MPLKLEHQNNMCEHICKSCRGAFWLPFPQRGVPGERYERQVLYCPYCGKRRAVFNEPLVIYQNHDKPELRNEG